MNGDQFRDIEQFEDGKTDLINHPSHYTEGRKYEPLDVIVDWNLSYMEGNILKYLSRWRRKNGVEDLKKARFYLDYLIRREEKV